MSNKFLLKRVSDGEEFPLSFGSMLVGRSDSCDVRVLSGQASREHARIRAHDSGAMVEDLHSTNGTFVNDKRIEEATLVKPGDVVRFDQEGFALQRQDTANETIYARPIRSGARGAMDIEEEDEEDVNATVFRQSFVMPPGWQNFEDDSSQASNMEDKKQHALNKFIDKSFAKLGGRHLIALVIAKGDDPPTIKTLALEDEEQRWSLGRNHSCDILVEQPDVSDVHCHLIFDHGQWSLEDNQSTNGLWQNNKKQGSINLRSGMDFYLASLKVTVRIEDRG